VAKANNRRPRNSGNPAVRGASPAGRGTSPAGQSAQPQARPRSNAELVEAAGKLAATHGHDSATPDAQAVGEVDEARLRRAVAQAERVVAEAEAVSRSARQHEEELAAGLAQLAADQAALAERAEGVRQREDAAADTEKRLAEREETLLGLEQDAKSDFARLRQEMLSQLRHELDGRRAAFEADEREQEAHQDVRLAAREDTLRRQVQEAQERAAGLAERELAQQRRERQLTARAEHLDQEVDDRIRERLTRLESDLEVARQHASGWQQRSESLRELVEQRGAELAGYEAAQAALGGRALPDAAAELRRLQLENGELRRAASAHPAPERERVAELEARHHDVMVEREELLRQNAELRRFAAATQISTTERENSRMINQALERLNETLLQEIEQNTEKLEKITAAAKDSSPFPACFAMDADEDLGHRPELANEPIDLAEFVTAICATMAADLELYYSEADMRCFVAGLAASRLHLLQGISGIGKTRLPEAFSQVIGAGRETVAVAAEWRTPQDLMGYYNAFERKFYETDFTQGLYRAQLPLFRDKPFFVVLDEMNLSHPEQYFSDLLSALERTETDPSQRPLLRLMTARVDPAPVLLKEGRALELPANVWFIGTANNDETTVRFADKTYDRAHVLELPSKPRPPQARESAPIAPVSLKVLQGAFDTAGRKRAGAVDQVLSFFDAELGAQLRDGIGISWGSRLERQAGYFVPVTLAAGGSLGEAADHLLATKILRKISGRVELQVGELTALRQDLEARWGKLCGKSRPVKSLRVLRSESRELGLV
jgi:AAA domain (dynein-related subfamily)